MKTDILSSFQRKFIAQMKWKMQENFYLANALISFFWGGVCIIGDISLYLASVHNIMFTF